MLLAALAVAGFLLFGGDDARAVTIPSVSGQSAAEAQATLENAGLEVAVQRVTNADVDAGDAIDTDPPAGSEVDEGDSVVLRVSVGPGLAAVPDVEGDEEAAATAELQRADFEVNTQQEASNDVNEGVVIRQSPAGGSQAEVGSAVTIVVSSGPENVAVPDVQQQDLSSAEAELNGAGLVVGNVSSQPNEDFAEGTVIRQSPGPGARVPEGSGVDLVLAAAPEQVTVPTIVGNTATDAQTKLQNAGFDVSTVEVDSDEPAGTVVSSDPAEGTEVDPGSTITISVSLGSSGGDPGSLGEGGGRATTAPGAAARSRPRREGCVRRRLAVLMGGRSSEHEVSLSSAEAVIAALDPERYEVVPVLISREGGWSVNGSPVALVPAPDGTPRLASLDGGPERTVDAVFPVLHGPNGEDGTVQGALEVAGAPYVGAGVAASAVAMDKAMFKVFLRDAGIPTPEHRVVTEAEWRARPDDVRSAIAERVGYPAFCKPARLGSSVGISPVPAEADLDAALALAFRHDPKALVERAISGREVEVGVLGEDEPIVSPVGEITYDSEWYDYATKYEPGRSRVEVPADLPDPVAQRARELALRAFQAVNCAGLARVNFFVSDGGEVLLSELNTMPGFTPTSVYATLMEAGGIAYPDLVNRLVELAVARAAQARRYAG